MEQMVRLNPVSKLYETVYIDNDGVIHNTIELPTSDAKIIVQNTKPVLKSGKVQKDKQGKKT